MKKSLAIIVVLLTLTAGADEFDAEFVKTRAFSDGQYCVYKHHQSGRLFVGKVPDQGCPPNQHIPPAMFGQVPTPVFSLFNEQEFLPLDAATIDKYFKIRSHIVDYRVGTVDTAEYEALISQLNRCAAFHVDIMGQAFVMTHDTNQGSMVRGKATIKGDTSLRIYSFSCNNPSGSGPSCAISCEHDCGDEFEVYSFEPIFDTPYSAMYRGVVPKPGNQARDR